MKVKMTKKGAGYAWLIYFFDDNKWNLRRIFNTKLFAKIYAKRLSMYKTYKDYHDRRTRSMKLLFFEDGKKVKYEDK